MRGQRLTGQKVKGLKVKDKLRKIVFLVQSLLPVPPPPPPPPAVHFLFSFSLASSLPLFPLDEATCWKRVFPATVQLDVRLLVAQQFPPGTMGGCGGVFAEGGGGWGGNTRCEQEVCRQPGVAATAAAASLI